MKAKKGLIVGIIGALAYVYLQQDEEDQELALQIGSGCGALARLVDISGQKFCEPKLKCRPGFVLSQDLTQCFDEANPCGSGFKMDDNGECQVTDEICGDRCYKLNAAQDNCIRIPNCGSATGSDIGDVFLYFGESIVAGIIYDALGRRVMKVADRVLAREAAKKASIEAAKALASKTAGEVAKGGAKASTKLATQTAAKRIAGESAKLVARRGAIQVALIAARKLAQKVAVQLAKIAALSSTGIGVLATPLMILSTSLSVGMSAAGIFWEVPPGYTDVKQWDDIPEGAQVAITSFPVLGDIIDMVMPYIFFTTNCAAGLESQNDLCYEPAHPDFKCDSFLCYAKHDTLVGYNPNNYLGGTLQHLTKKIIMDTGTIPNNCPPNQEHGEGGLLCYDKQNKPGRTIAGTFWADCREGFRDDKLACTKEHIDPCGPGEWEPAGTRECYGNRTDYIDDCSLGTDPCKTKTFNHAKCMRWGRLTSASLVDDHCKEWGGWECIGGCRSRAIQMPELRKTFAARHFWIDSYTKESAVLQPKDNICVPPRSENIAGLCYPNASEMPQGYQRKVIGTLDPGCPGDKDSWRGFRMFNSTKDIGVSCQVATYTRPPFPKLGVYPKRKVVIEDPKPPPLPPLCSTLPVLQPDNKDYNQRLCRESEPPSGFSLSVDGLLFFKKCRDLFDFNIKNGRCETIDTNGEPQSYENLEGLMEVQYDFK